MANGLPQLVQTPPSVRQRLDIPRFGDPRLGGPFGVAPGNINEVADLIAALVDVRGGAQAGKQNRAAVANLFNVAFGETPEGLERPTPEEAPQITVRGVKNIARRPLKALRERVQRKRALGPPTGKALSTQRDILARRLQSDPAFFKQVQENDAQRQAINTLLQPIGINVPSLLEQQRAQGIPSDVQSFQLFRQLGLQEAQRLGLPEEDQQDFARKFAETRTSAALAGLPAQQELQRQRTAGRLEVGEQRGAQARELAEFRVASDQALELFRLRGRKQLSEQDFEQQVELLNLRNRTKAEADRVKADNDLLQLSLRLNAAEVKDVTRQIDDEINRVFAEEGVKAGDIEAGLEQVLRQRARNIVLLRFANVRKALGIQIQAPTGPGTRPETEEVAPTAAERELLDLIP